MSGFAGTLAERVTLLMPGPRDDLGAAGGWQAGGTVWASVRPDGAGGGDDAGAAPRWVVTMRAGAGEVRRLRWGTRTLRVRRIEADPATPDRIVLRTEDVR